MENFESQESEMPKHSRPLFRYDETQAQRVFSRQKGKKMYAFSIINNAVMIEQSKALKKILSQLSWYRTNIAIPKPGAATIGKKAQRNKIQRMADETEACDELINAMKKDIEKIEAQLYFEVESLEVYFEMFRPL